MTSKKFYFVYKTVRDDGAFYIGKHSTDNLEDGYIGSGLRLKRSIAKHGKSAHSRQILQFCDDESDLRKLESEILTEEILNDPLCLNLAPGGQGGNIGGGGFFSEEHKQKFHSGGGRALASKCEVDPTFKCEIGARKASSMKQFISKADDITLHRRKALLQQATVAAQSDSAKSKRKETCRLRNHSVGSKNPNYGKKWMNDGTTNKGVPVDQIEAHLQNGWNIGMLRRIK